MSSLSISGILLDVLNRRGRLKRKGVIPSIPDHSWFRAVNKTLKALNNLIPPLIAIQGPPGTGKTSVYVEVLHNVLKKIEIDKELNRNRMIVYVAPTNQLVAETFSRLVQTLLLIYDDPKKVIEFLIQRVRVYGSKISPLGSQSEVSALKKVFKSLGLGHKNVLELEKVTGIVPKPSDVGGTVFVFTTEWQRVGARVSEVSEVKLLIDEASRTPFHRPFTVIADIIGKKFQEGIEELPNSLAVVGDPEQAIALEPEYQLRGKELLVMKKVIEILEELGIRNENFEFLEFTKRLPKPTHEPISKAYYEGKLKAIYDPKQVLKGLECIEVLRNVCETLVLKLSDRTYIEKLCSLVENVITSQIPIGIVDVNAFPAGDTFEPFRVKIGTYLATIFALFFKRLGLPITVTAIAPYTEIPISMEFYFRYRIIRQLGEELEFTYRPTFTTVQSMLGGEADVVIAILGKEWIPKGSLKEFLMNLEQDPYLTIYYREPELLNVQLSRHKRMLIIIGDTKRMHDSAASLAQTLGLKLYEFKEQGIRYGILYSLLEGAKKIHRVWDAVEELQRDYGIPSLNLKK